MFEGIKIRNALVEASKEIQMDEEKSLDILKEVLLSQNMNSNVEFNRIKTKQKFIRNSLVLNTGLLASISVVLAVYCTYIPKIENVVVENNLDSTYIKLDLANKMGVREVFAIDENGNVIQSQIENGNYTIGIENNGQYTIKIVNGVGNISEKVVNVNIVDNLGPTIDNCTNFGNQYNITYSDVSEIDVSSAYGIGDNGVIKPYINGNVITYNYAGETFKVFVKDIHGNISEYLINNR